ncbi:hypothetical protein D9757_007027 [Collybiopsis confluens]|uniref:NADP-dependent oxidoreductase domain-containing protein n=1 Tax=Collybiopsis confluens TaxID=2823264 RepID=A0A8H5M4P9_9AGAR|nr:hypothetical protein D9757_007027 [Collybiopsis confluens]
MSIRLNDGSEIPGLAYGTGSKLKFRDITHYIQLAIEKGFAHIDTASCSYAFLYLQHVPSLLAVYQTEKYVGKAIKESGLARSDLYITTKYFPGHPVRQRIKESLDDLGLEYVDLYLIHQPQLSNVPALWKEFEEVQKEGLARQADLPDVMLETSHSSFSRSIGVSNLIDPQQLENLIKVSNVTPAVNQIQLHPYNHHKMKHILDACASHGIVIEAYSSLSPITVYPGGPVDIPVRAAAERLGATPTQVVFLWIKAKGAVVVTTSTNEGHMEEYLAFEDLPPLTAEEVASIDAAGAGGPPGFASTWGTIVTGVVLLAYGLVKMLLSVD